MTRRRVVVPALLGALACLFSGSIGAQDRPAPPDRAEHGTFRLDRFTFESGPTVPNVSVAYGTYGRLNAARDNAILLPSHYLANHHGYEWLIGPGRAKYLVLRAPLRGRR